MGQFDCEEGVARLVVWEEAATRGDRGRLPPAAPRWGALALPCRPLCDHTPAPCAAAKAAALRPQVPWRGLWRLAGNNNNRPQAPPHPSFCFVCVSILKQAQGAHPEGVKRGH
jgi:hypothetical protein